MNTVYKQLKATAYQVNDTR